MKEGTADIERANAQGKGFAARLSIARRLSRELHEPAEKIFSLGNDFASHLHQIDPGLRAMIEKAPLEARDNPQYHPVVCTFFQQIRNLSAAAHEGLRQVQSMIEAISPVEALSRDLRNPLRRLKKGLTLMVEAREVTDEWVDLIEGTSIDCDDVSTDVMEQHPEGRKREVRDLD